ncbi:MAG: hypothetical protein K8S23_11365 [Candidatus Cloacimonetes bacterium]|nr:hypothetical protein [Candidatus Cloacimonadota bacterium]
MINLEYLIHFFNYMYGIFFYHFIVLKINNYFEVNIKKIYLISIIIILTDLIFRLLFNSNSLITVSLQILPFAWTFFWIFTGIIILWKSQKENPSNEKKRLLFSFIGIIIILCSSILFVVSKILTQFTSAFNFTNVFCVFFIFIGFVWLLFTLLWSLLTSTILEVKIRSALIYTIVGVVFITIFGLIDYTLGELLQTLFGKFMGSEFIAGIPATIVLLAIFSPVRNKVEKFVDNKLNTSDLDFLEKTGTFTEKLSEEGVVEGFEEYICENLIKRLPIEKVALISFDKELNDFKFNEIRGSNVIENSIVEDERLILKDKTIIQSYDKLLNNPQDISGFPLVISIINDTEQKWYLALGKKNDGSLYNKNDVKAFTKLADKIKLSLKFILAYEDIVNDKYVKIIRQKDNLILELNAKLGENVSI